MYNLTCILTNNPSKVVFKIEEQPLKIELYGCFLTYDECINNLLEQLEICLRENPFLSVVVNFGDTIYIPEKFNLNIEETLNNYEKL